MPIDNVQTLCIGEETGQPVWTVGHRCYSDGQPFYRTWWRGQFSNPIEQKQWSEYWCDMLISVNSGSQICEMRVHFLQECVSCLCGQGVIFCKLLSDVSPQLVSRWTDGSQMRFYYSSFCYCQNKFLRMMPPLTLKCQTSESKLKLFSQPIQSCSGENQGMMFIIEGSACILFPDDYLDGFMV